MKKQIPLSALLKLISFYSLIVGIIGTILIVGVFTVSQKNKVTPTPTITLTITPTITISLPDIKTTDENLGEDFVVCTMEARKCLDGSYVGREGPNCEFAACPGN